MTSLPAADNDSTASRTTLLHNHTRTPPKPFCTCVRLRSPAVDRRSFFDESVCCVFGAQVPAQLKKGLVILVAVVLAPVLLVGLVALAAGDWRQIGTTEAGDKVSVSSVRVQKHNLRTAWVRVEFKEPMKLAQGGPFAELRARVRFNCASGAATPNSVWFYTRDRSGRLMVSKKASHDEQFGTPSEGNFGEMTKTYVCQQK